MWSRQALLAYLWVPFVALRNQTPEQITIPPDAVCFKIAKSISSASEVFYPGDPSYEKGISHFAISSTQQSRCVVEAGSPADVGKILGILGKTNTPFAVKGGGHATNPGFSSTPGVHISMSRFSEIKYDAVSKTADIGAGLIWDDVYAALEPLGINVIGGRITGVGVAGFTLGGGYSFKTNQYGLAIDNVVAFELVKPDGTAVTVTHASDPELFFGLKGGLNNFGIVTKFTLKTFPQTQIWGGAITNLESAIPNIAAATATFQTSVTDPKAAIIMAYTYEAASQQVIASQLLFYDAPTPPPGIFDDFLAIPSIQSDISTRSYLSLVQSSQVNAAPGARDLYDGVPILAFTPGLSDVLLNETMFWGAALGNKSEIALSYAIEIFLPSIYSHNSDKTAFPPVRNIPFKPFNIAYSWNSSKFDPDFHKAAVDSAAHIHKAALAEGQTQLVHAPHYPNYAVTGTPLADMYGRNLPALRALKARVDPNNVMGLAGGWKF
ncbi:FAD dependent oxidoreductase [Flammula alnicola]|nr:FAD dependent oxidoreductase [Flammula alnicola]